MNVPFIDFSGQYKTIKKEIDSGFKGVFKRGDYILGQDEKEFEAAFAGYCGVRFGIGVNSGTDALYLALSALDVGPGDEVILPTFTFIATALCVSYTNAKVVFVDIEPETYNIDPQALQKVITPRTKVIIPVHLYGQPSHMAEIQRIAKQHGIKVVEDAAQAHGSTYHGKKIGSIGDIACFSFYPTKSLGAAGDGGMVVTNDPKIHEKVLMLRDYGRVGRYEHKIKGHNSRLDTLQAVVLLAKLKRLDQWNTMRAQNAATYNQLLKGVIGVKTPTVKNDRTHVYQTYAVRVKNRDQVLEGLKKKGIGVLIHYPIPLHLQEVYKELGHKPGDFPVAEDVAKEILSLPMFPHMKKAQIQYVCDHLKSALNGKS